MSKDKADLFRLLDAFNDGDHGHIDSLSDEEVKSLSPYVLLMWVHGATSNTANHVLMTNEHVNGVVFSQQKHPRLLLKLFAAANSGMGRSRYKFKKSVTKSESNILKYIAKHYQCGYDQAKEIRDILGEEDIKELNIVYGDQEK